MSKKHTETGPENLQKVYSNKVLIGNWFEDAQLADFKWCQGLTDMRKGNLMLARFRAMTDTCNKPVVMTQSTGFLRFGDTIGIYAPHVPASDPPIEGKNGVLMQGLLSSNQIMYHTDLVDGCNIVLSPIVKPMAKNAFVITSADYCDRKEEPLKYNQEFMITLASSVEKTPLHVRYDLDALPGINGLYPLYLSEHAVSNCRWRVLPVRKPHVTRFEEEGHKVPVNTDVIVNHCPTNVNLCVNVGVWTSGFYSKLGVPTMKTCLDIYGKEKPNNIWQIYAPLQK